VGGLSHNLSAYQFYDLILYEQVFDDVTHLFSQAEVPLVHETVPLFERLEKQLNDIIDNYGVSLPPVICVAAYAAHLMLQKYIRKTLTCKSLQISTNLVNYRHKRLGSP
jgi:hypothetical protein